MQADKQQTFRVVNKAAGLSRSSGACGHVRPELVLTGAAFETILQGKTEQFRTKNALCVPTGQGVER